jgi:DNA-directed RNA polymerase subunit M/transcription elongation factor TFIIS
MKVDKEIRTNTFKELNNIIKNKSISKNIEKGLHRYAKEYVEINNINEELTFSVYNDKKNIIIANLENNINNEYDNLFLQKIHGGDFNPLDIAYLESNAIDPIHWKNITARQLYREDKIKNIATTNMFECDRCHESRCSVTQMQTRSIDEPMTVFVECHVCGHTFTV